MTDVPSKSEVKVGPLRWLVEGLLLAALVSFVGGLFLPAIEVRSLWVHRAEISIFDGIRALFGKGDVFFGVLLALFTLVLPSLRFILAFALLALQRHGPLARRLTGLLREVSKWAMTDVFVLALIIMVLNGELLRAADLRPGAAFFTLSVLLYAVALALFGKIKPAAKEPA